MSPPGHPWSWPQQALSSSAGLGATTGNQTGMVTDTGSYRWEWEHRHIYADMRTLGNERLKPIKEGDINPYLFRRIFAGIDTQNIVVFQASDVRTCHYGSKVEYKLLCLFCFQPSTLYSSCINVQFAKNSPSVSILAVYDSWRASKQGTRVGHVSRPRVKQTCETQHISETCLLHSDPWPLIG